MSDTCKHGVNKLNVCTECLRVKYVEAESSFAAPTGSGAPDQARKECEACEGRGRHLIGHTGFGAAMYQSCIPCKGMGHVPVPPNTEVSHER